MLMMALESLLSESQTSKLTQAQNELSAFTLIFFIILFVNMRYAPLSFSEAHKFIRIRLSFLDNFLAFLKKVLYICI